MKKKIVNKKKPAPVLRGRKSKIDVVIESLVHLEQRVKELISKVKDLEQQTTDRPRLKWNPPEYN